MKKAFWQILAVSGVLVLGGCSKKDESAAVSEEKEVPMSAAPADNKPMTDASDDSAQNDAVPSEAAASDTADDALDDQEEIVEVVEFDEEAAKTATQDAEVEDEAEQK